MKYITAYFCAVIFIGDNMGKEVAIIIPAYNAHDTIEDLLLSISIQEIKELCKIIIVDDCSNKNYFYLIKKFPWLDIKIIRHSKNSGPGIARNTGIEEAIKEKIPYIVFADADDCFYSWESLSLLYKQIKDNDYVVGGFLETDNTKKTNYLHKDIDTWLFGKMYWTKILEEHNIRFFPLAQNEDVAFNAWYFLYTESKLFLKDAVIYVWKDNNNSITRRNQGQYSCYCLIGLCINLKATYLEAVKDPTIERESLYENMAVHFINVFLAYNELLNFTKRPDDLTSFWDAMKELYREAYLPFEPFFPKHLWLKTWAGMSFKPDYMIKIGFDDFMKEIKK